MDTKPVKPLVAILMALSTLAICFAFCLCLFDHTTAGLWFLLAGVVLAVGGAAEER